MSAAELATLERGDDLYVRARLVDNFGDDLVIEFIDPRGSHRLRVGASEILNFAPLTLKQSGQPVALRLADFNIPLGASTWSTANAKR